MDTGISKTESIRVEDAFARLRRSLRQPSTPVWRLHALGKFLDDIGSLQPAHEGYILELLEDLERIGDHLPDAGTDPALIARFAERLRELSLGSSLLGGSLDRVISQLCRNAAAGFIHVGAIEEAYALLAYETARPEWWRNGRTLKELIHAATAARHRDATWLERVAAPSQAAGRVCVPVVEEPYDPVDSSVRCGALQWIYLTLRPAHRTSISPAFEAYADDGEQISYEACVAASVAIAQSSQSFEGRLKQNGSGYPLRGRSAELAIGGLFVAGMQRADERRSRYEVNPDAALTGTLDESGRIGVIDSLPLKVEAVFFSACSVLVVPASQLAEARSESDRLRATYPNRSLTVVGVEELNDLFFDRRITSYVRPSAISHAAGWVWRRKYSAGVLSVFAMLVLVIVALAVGPVDRNPAGFTQDAFGFDVTNASGRFLWRATNSLTGVQWNPHRGLALGALADIDGDGRNEFCWGVYNKAGLPDIDPGVGHLLCGSDGDTRLDIPLAFEIDYPFDPTLMQGLFNPRGLMPLDIDGNGTDEIILNLSHEQYYPALIVAIEVATGTVLGRYDHPGALYTAELFDLDRDGQPELIAAGTNNSLREGIIVALDPYQLSGTGPATGEYRSTVVPTGTELAYIRVAPNGMSRMPGTAEEHNMTSLAFNSEKLVFVTVAGVGTTPSGRLMSASLLYEFDNRMRPITIGSNNDYAALADLMKREGRWDDEQAALLDIGEVTRYWDGEIWHGEPWTRLPE